MTQARGISAKSLSGRGSFFAGRRCKPLVMMASRRNLRLVRQKNGSRESHKMSEFDP